MWQFKTIFLFYASFLAAYRLQLWPIFIFVIWCNTAAGGMEKLENKIRIAPKERWQTGTLSAQKRWKFVLSPQKTELTEVAKQMADLYPESFVDRVGGDVIAGGYNHLSNRLCEWRDNVSF